MGLAAWCAPSYTTKWPSPQELPQSPNGNFQGVKHHKMLIFLTMQSLTRKWSNPSHLRRRGKPSCHGMAAPPHLAPPLLFGPLTLSISLFLVFFVHIFVLNMWIIFSLDVLCEHSFTSYVAGCLLTAWVRQISVIFLLLPIIPGTPVTGASLSLGQKGQQPPRMFCNL